MGFPGWSPSVVGRVLVNVPNLNMPDPSCLAGGPVFPKISKNPKGGYRYLVMLDAHLSRVNHAPGTVLSTLREEGLSFPFYSQEDGTPETLTHLGEDAIDIQ